MTKRKARRDDRWENTPGGLFPRRLTLPTRRFWRGYFANGEHDECCCDVDCEIYEDLFDCDDSPPATPEWHQYLGTWAFYDANYPTSCNSPILHSSSGESAIVCRYPTDDVPQVVQVEIQENTGSRPRVLLGVNYNPTTHAITAYHFIEFDFDNDQINIGHGTAPGSAETVDLTVSETLSSSATVEVHVSGEDGSSMVSIGGGAGGGDCHFQGGWICATAPAGKYAGLGNGPNATARAEFVGGSGNGFVLLNHTDTPGVPYPCGDCDCLCGSSCVPRKLYYYLTKLSGSDPCCLASASGTFDHTDTATEDVCTWEADTIDLGCTDDGTPGGTEYDLNLKFRKKPITTRKGACSTWEMEDAGYPGATKAGMPIDTPDSCTCDPLYFKWEFEVEYDGEGAGYCKYRLEIYDEEL